VLSVALVLAWLLSGVSPWLRDQIARVSGNTFVEVALYFIVFGAVYAVLFAPLIYYAGFVLPRRYGLLTQLLASWLGDQVKGGAIGLVFGLIAIEVIYVLLRAFPTLWWLPAGIAMLFFIIALGMLAPVLIVPLFFKQTPLADKELVRRLIALAERARTHVEGVYTIGLSVKTTAANAALMGLGKTRRIVLGDTLYRDYTADEIEIILAHELGHHVNRDIGRLIAAQTVLTFVGLFLASLALSWGAAQFGFNGSGDIAAFPLLAMVLGAFGLVTMPLGNAYSRWREMLADEYALQATKNPDAFISMMTKLANQNLSEVNPAPWVEWLFYDHPPIAKRLRHAEVSRSNPSAEFTPSPAKGFRTGL
jgi:STE24 endopeptidase